MSTIVLPFRGDAIRAADLGGEGSDTLTADMRGEDMRGEDIRRTEVLFLVEFILFNKKINFSS
jgi:hypothetical protein